MRFIVLALSATLALTACDTGTGGGRLGADGKPLPQVYKLRPGDEGRLQLRMQDSVNTLRRARGLSGLELNAQLNAAAATHARDMSVQNRPWHFGSDGSSPIDRARRVGYPGTLLGELISETFETELETLAAWMEAAETREIIMQPAAREMGFAYYQEANGKIWWTMVTGGGSGFDLASN
jgi:uncharacterized protein YkwD